MQQAITISSTPDLQMQNEDSAWIAEAVKNPQKFEPLYKKYYSLVYAFVYKRIANYDEVMDITSQVFVQALSHLNSYRDLGNPFGAWLLRIARNEVAGFYRNASKKKLVDLDDAGIEKLQAEMPISDGKEEIKKLFNKLDNLKTDEMELIQMRFFEDRSFAEMALILNMTETNARVKTFRVIQKLKNLWGKG